MKPSGEPRRPLPGPTEPGLPGEPPARPESTSAAYERSFALAAFTMNRFVIDQMLRAARQFDGDYEMLVIFGVLSHLNVAHLMPPGSRPTQVLDRDGRVPDSQPRLRPVRLRDLAQITGIPRETIRRKLERLLAQGRVSREVRGWTLTVASVVPEMRALSVDGVRRFVEAADAVRAVLRDAERAIAAEAPLQGGVPARPRR